MRSSFKQATSSAHREYVSRPGYKGSGQSGETTKRTKTKSNGRQPVRAPFPSASVQTRPTYVVKALEEFNKSCFAW